MRSEARGWSTKGNEGAGGRRPLAPLVETLPSSPTKALRRAAAALVALPLSAAGSAVAQVPFTSLPDGRYVVEYAGYRLALMPWGQRAGAGIDLCFAGEPKISPRGKDWDQRIEWPLSRILQDTDGFRRELSQAKALSVDQRILTTEKDAEAGQEPPAPVLANSATMFVDINPSGPDDQPCYGFSERVRAYSVVDEARRTFERPEHPGAHREDFGPLVVYQADPKDDYATGKVEAKDRSFAASGPLYVWCSWPDCRRYSRSADRVVTTQFSFTTGPDSIDPSRWMMLDRYFHELTSDVFLDHRPVGVE